MQARDFLMKARMYRFFSVMFAFIGILILVFVYIHHAEGNFFAIVQNPLVIIVVVFPYIPAILFTLLAGRAEAKLDKFISEFGKQK